jgi:hypothetical protein
MRLPRGRLVRSRVVADPATVLSDALDRALTGYAVLEPQEAVLLDGDAHGVLTFDDGVPVVAYHSGTDRGGPPALADLAQPGPYAAELYELAAADLASVNEAQDLRVPPGTPAERLGGKPELADRTRATASDDRTDAGGVDPVVSFLEDDEKVAAIREQAREEAQQRAAEWGLDGALE